MQFIFIFLIVFNFVLTLTHLSLANGANPVQAQQPPLRKCKFYSSETSDVDDEEPGPECGKDSTFCYSLWRIASESSSSINGQESYSHSQNFSDQTPISSSFTSTHNNSVVVTNEYASDANSTATINTSITHHFKFVKQGCWEASPKSTCDNKNCTSIIKTNLDTGVITIEPNQQFFCCCAGDYCNEIVHVVERNEDDDDYLDQFRDRGEYAGYDQQQHDHETHAQQVNRWVVLSSIFLAIVSSVGCGFWLIYRWRNKKQAIKNKDEEMVEVEEKLIGNGGPGGISGVIVRDAYDDGKNWHLSKDETIVLGNEIAKGKYATVFNGRVGGSTVALKIFASEHKDVYKNERWILECLARFKSDRIIKYHGWQELQGSSGPEMIIVLDRISPGSLRDYLCSENLNLTLDQCLKICSGILEGMSIIHGCNPEGVVIAHRDLTTKNILIDNELNTYLADFGLSLKTHGSKYTFGGNMAGCVEKQAETSNLCEAGTLRYMAPEILEGAVNLKEVENCLKQIDIYAVAIIIWEVINLCGDIVLNVGHRLPFHELGKEITMESLTRAVVLRRQRPTFTNWRDHLISRQLRETIVEAWDHEPEARLTSLCILERLHEALLNASNSSLIAGLKAAEEPLESNCYNDDEIWISRNPNLERNLLFGKNGDDSASSTQYLVTMSDKHRTPSSNMNSSMSNNPNNPSNHNIVSHNNQHNSNHSNLLPRHHRSRHHHPNTEQSISTDGGESMTTMNTELSSSASLTNFVQNVL